MFLKWKSVIFLSATTITERHFLLYHTIGCLEQEVTAYQRVWIITGIAIGFLAVSTVLEVFLFLKYNEEWHPFGKILITKISDTESEHHVHDDIPLTTNPQNGNS